MMQNTNDTITAISTPQGNGALAVIRMSGPQSLDIINKVFKPFNNAPLQHRMATLGTVLSDNQQMIDQVVVTAWMSPHSYTGQDVVEISCHGGHYIVQHILQLLISNGARLAGPGEFSIRAFLNGKMDLIQAEAIVDVINANTQSALRASQQQLTGQLSNHFNILKKDISHQLALLETELDFAEEDIEFSNRNELKSSLQQIVDKADTFIQSFQYGQIIRSGANMVIAGAPNVGKSSLLNVLLEQDRAIVSDIPGTTRDSLEESLNINGYWFRISDTAGIRDTSDVIEQEGVNRTHHLLKHADIVLYMIDASAPENPNLVQQTIQNMPKVILLINKIDLLASDYESIKSQYTLLNRTILDLSIKREQGLDNLKETLVNELFGDNPLLFDQIITHTRHHTALLKAREHVMHALQSIDQKLSSEFIALDIRSALDYIGEIVGQVTTDDILNDIFSKFCVGK